MREEIRIVVKYRGSQNHLDLTIVVFIFMIYDENFSHEMKCFKKIDSSASDYCRS